MTKIRDSTQSSQDNENIEKTNKGKGGKTMKKRNGAS